MYGIQHHYITLKWLRCNGMTERLIKTIEHGIIVMSTLQDNIKTWDFQLPRLLYGYRCGVHASTRIYLFMVLIGRILRLKVSNFLSGLTQTFDEELGVEQFTKQMIVKMELIAKLHKTILGNNELAQAY